MIIELEGIRKEAAVAKFKVVSRYLPGGTKENYEKTSDSFSWSPGRVMNPAVGTERWKLYKKF
jgi:hypothetical protein